MMRKTMDVVKERFGNQVIVGVEVGVSSGVHALNILQNMPNVKLLYLVDPYFGGLVWTGYDKTHVDEERKAKAKVRLTRYSDRICWVHKEFEKCTVEDLPESLDFSYIDADHGYEHVKNNLSLASQFVKEGGVIGGHDAGCLDIDRAVKDFCERKQIKSHVENNGYFMIQGKLKAQGWDWWFINV